MKKHSLTMRLRVMATLSVALTLGMSEAAAPLMTVPSASSAGAPEVSAASAPLERMRALRKGVGDAEEAYLKAAAADREGNPRDTTEQLWKAYTRTNDASIPIVLEWARKAPASATAFEMIEWIVLNRRIHARSLMPFGFQAIELARDHHASNTNIGRICATIGNNWDPEQTPALDFLAAAIERNPDRIARGQAAFALARLRKKRTVSPNADDAKKASQEAERLLEMVVKQYADCPYLYRSEDAKGRLGDEAARELFDLRHLSIGCVAPELKGEDLDGRKLQLSDYRGKVVVVAFWATWCGPCMEMVPHERTLVERLQGKPFALLGVNGDDDRTKLKRALEKERITWRSFCDGGSDGPISTGWNIRAWPTVYVIDSAGVIRFKDVFEKELDNAVDQLISENGDRQAP